jgi:hypothetical protein
MPFGESLRAFARHPLNTLKQIDHSNAKRLGDQAKAAKGDVHASVFKGANLCPMKAGNIREFILRPAALLAQLANTHSYPPLKFLTLHHEKCGGILLKRILLIRRAGEQMVLAIVVWIFCGIGAAFVAQSRGASGCLWFGLGVLLGLFGLALVSSLANLRIHLTKFSHDGHAAS